MTKSYDAHTIGVMNSILRKSFAAVSYRDLAPDDPMIVRWELDVGGDDGFPATPGTYRFVAHLNTHGTDLKHSVVIR